MRETITKQGTGGSQVKRERQTYPLSLLSIYCTRAVQENRPKSGIKSPIMSQCLGDKALQERRDLPQAHNQSSPQESYKTLKL